MKYKQIVFDIDGTLLNNEYAVLQSFAETMKAVTGKDYTHDDLRFSLGITGENALKKMGVSDVSAALQLWIERLNSYGDTVRIFEGIEELLAVLEEAGFQMGIVTSKTRGEFEKVFSQYPIAGYFKTAVCAEDTTEHKPYPGPLLKYMELTGTEAEELLYIGDSRYDGACAKGAGVDFALAVWGCTDKTVEARYYLDEPGELLSRL